MEPVVVLGAGLAGLGTAHFLGDRSWCVVEKAERVGGLIKTEVIEGFLFDATGHWLHLRDPEIRRLVTEHWLPGKLLTVERKAAIFSRGVFTRFPYQVNTYGLPPEVVAENLIGYVEANFGEKGRALREREPSSFAEFILRYLGEGFAKNFMVPYNRKLWTVDPTELSAAWCGRFVPKPSLREVVEGALGVGGDRIGYNASFVYPSEGGIEALAKAILARLRGGEVLLGREPVSIDWAKRTVLLSDERSLPYGHLVSTIALPHLVSLLARGGAGCPAEVVDASRRLRATTVTHVSVGVATPNRQPWHWIYLPEAEFQTYRIGSPSAVFAGLAPPGRSSFYVEYSHQGDLSAEACERQALDDLVRSRMIHRKEDVLFARASDIPHAYVLYDTDYGPAKERILRFLKEVGIHTAGRYGQWEYSSMEDALMEARSVVRELSS